MSLHYLVKPEMLISYVLRTIVTRRNSRIHHCIYTCLLSRLRTH